MLPSPRSAHRRQSQGIIAPTLTHAPRPRCPRALCSREVMLASPSSRLQPDVRDSPAPPDFAFQFIPVAFAVVVLTVATRLCIQCLVMMPPSVPRRGACVRLFREHTSLRPNQLGSPPDPPGIHLHQGQLSLRQRPLNATACSLATESGRLPPWREVRDGHIAIEVTAGSGCRPCSHPPRRNADCDVPCATGYRLPALA